LIIGPVTAALPGVGFALEIGSGAEARRAERLRWAKISAGIDKVKMRNIMAGAKAFVLTQPS